MNNIHRDNINETLNNAIAAYKSGDYLNARKWSMKAVLNTPASKPVGSFWLLFLRRIRLLDS